MKEFVLAALPWVLAGVSVAIICAGMGGKQSREKEKKMERHIAVGAVFGVLLGVAFNVCGLWDNHTLDFAIGPLMGMALATIWNKVDEKKG